MENKTMENKMPKQPSGRGLKWALGLSLALNLVIVGFVGGAVLRHAGEGRGDRGPSLQSYGAPFVRALPREAKRKLREALRGERAELPSRKDRRALYSELLEALRADDFDADAARVVFATQSGAAQNMQDRAQAAWIALISEMPAPERAAVADRLEETLKRGRKKRERRP